MTKREVVLEALAFRRPPYVPWSWGPTEQCAERLKAHLGTEDLSGFLDSHFVGVGAGVGRMTSLGDGLFRDAYGVVWDRTVDRDIGTPCEWPIREPGGLKRYRWPDDSRWYDGAAEALAAHRDLFSVYYLGFSLYERAWTMRGMQSSIGSLISQRSVSLFICGRMRSMWPAWSRPISRRKLLEQGRWRRAGYRFAWGLLVFSAISDGTKS